MPEATTSGATTAATPAVTAPAPDALAHGGPVHDAPAVGARIFRVVVGVVVAAAALKLASPVLVPLVGGVFLAVLARPLQRRLAEALPRPLRWLGLVTAMLAVLVGVAAFGGALYVSARAVADELRDRRPRLEATLAQARQRIARAGLPVSTLPEVPGGGQTGASRPQPAPSSAPPASRPSGSSEAAAASGDSVSGGSESGGSAAAGVIRRAASGLTGALGGLLLALGFCALGLTEAGAARRRLARAVPDRATPEVLRTVDEAAAAFRRYAWVKTLTSAITGLATGLASLAFGLPLAWVWGFLAFLLEYVPSVGSVIAVLPPTLMALADGGPAHALAVFLGIGALQVFLGNVVDPKLEGRFMAVSPFVVLLSIVVWGWLWGPAGALLAVPMTVAAVITCRHVPGARGVATLLGEERDAPAG